MRRKYFNDTEVIKSEDGQPAAIISTSRVDRDGDTIDPRGWQLDDYRKNGVVLFGHDSRSIPVGKTTTIGLVNGKLGASWRWNSKNPTAALVQQAWDDENWATEPK